MQIINNQDKMKHTLLLFATILLLGIQSYAQNVSINNDGSEPDPSAALDVKASDKGVLIPRVDFNNLPVSPATGLLVYVTANGPEGNDAFYYYDGTQWHKLSGAAGLENFTESNYTHDTKTGVKFLATNVATDVDFVISPKGTGAILAQQPDGTTAGGNNRGANSIDLQTIRVDAAQVASGDYSTIIGGRNNTASGNYSTVIGIGSTANGLVSTAIGNSALSSGNTSTSIGLNTIASGNASTALGSQTTASAYSSTSMGYNTIASGNASTTMGGNTTASGSYSIATGYYSNAGGEYSTAMGTRTNAPSAFETVLGRYNTDYSPLDAYNWNSNDRLFVIGNGTASSSKSNALTILKNANTTIGGSLTVNGNGTNTSVTFPTTRGTSGQVLTSDGSGGVNWATLAGGGSVTSVSGTAPIVSSGGAAPVISISEATPSASGSMSAADKTKLNGIAAGAEVNVNADWNASSGDAQILNKPAIDGSETKLTAGTNVTLTGSGTTASPYVVNATETDPSVPAGTQTGQMQYWNGMAWVTLAAGSNGQILTFLNGVPTWLDQDTKVDPVTGQIWKDVTTSTGKTWMDRNLGATQAATNIQDPAALGYLFNWGRAAEGHHFRAAGKTSTNATTAVPNLGNAWDGLFIFENIVPLDWLTPQDGTLWEGVNGTNNPCPSGYRLPTNAEWEAERVTWSPANANGAFASPLKLTMAGLRFNDNGSVGSVGEIGYYWSSDNNTNYARALSISYINNLMNNFARANGFCVRCIKD
jgi:uncharacterized protein (TIGR02145 family)